VLRTNSTLPTFSELIFEPSSVVQFLKSSDAPIWSQRAYLVVRNWTGLVKGGGGNQLRVGQNQAGLSREQLRRVIFENPANLPPADYTARILATGEVVPDAAIRIGLSQRGNRAVLTWNEAYHLETTTNLASPSQWLSVTKASPLTIRFSEPQRYYRLRRY
jgi:hypothetical protein